MEPEYLKYIENRIQEAEQERATEFYCENLGIINTTGETIKILSSLPASIGKLQDLISLSFPENILATIPDSIGNLSNLERLDLGTNELTELPESIGNLFKLKELDVSTNQLNKFPNTIVNITNLEYLYADRNKLISLPEDIGNLASLKSLFLCDNNLSLLPDSIINLYNLESLSASSNNLKFLPELIGNLSKLCEISLSGNPIEDLSILQNISQLYSVSFLGASLPRRYWTKLSDWKSEWLLDERNIEVRRALIDRLGYQKICEDLNAVKIDSWREYTLLKIDGVEKIYNREEEPNDTEPMVLLKMTCPSTAHIHILRVPPEVESAEAAIVWVNHGIHPDKFAIQT